MTEILNSETLTGHSLLGYAFGVSADQGGISVRVCRSRAGVWLGDTLLAGSLLLGLNGRER